MLWLLLGVTLLDAIPALPGLQSSYLYLLAYGIATPAAAGISSFMLLRSDYPEKLSEHIGRWKRMNHGSPRLRVELAECMVHPRRHLKLRSTWAQIEASPMYISRGKFLDIKTNDAR